MASAAQLETSYDRAWSPTRMKITRLNAAVSRGPKTRTGKARSSHNHLKFGLFSIQNCVWPKETAAIHQALQSSLEGTEPRRRRQAIVGC